jgi:hypothetical protein
MGRAVKQVLLLHMNYLNSLYLDDLLQRFRDDGWSFITFAEALKDEVYKLSTTMSGCGAPDTSTRSSQALDDAELNVRAVRPGNRSRVGTLRPLADGDRGSDPVRYFYAYSDRPFGF